MSEGQGAILGLLHILPRPEVRHRLALREVRQHDGSVLRLRKLHEDYDPVDRIAAMDYLQRRHADGEIVTGLLYVDPDAGDLHAALNTVGTPLNQLGARELIPGAAALEKFNATLR